MRQEQQKTSTNVNMKVANFMVPRSKVVTCYRDDTLDTVMKKMLSRSIGSVIVMPKAEEDLDDLPIGIVTKTDLIAGWERGLEKTDMVSEVMGRNIEAVLDTAPSASAAEHFENTKHRHASVVDKDNNFVGILTAYDIAVETARDNKAWPYVNRDVLHEKYKVPTKAHAH